MLGLPEMASFKNLTRAPFWLITFALGTGAALLAWFWPGKDTKPNTSVDSSVSDKTAQDFSEVLSSPSSPAVIIRESAGDAASSRAEAAPIVGPSQVDIEKIERLRRVHQESEQHLAVNVGAEGSNSTSTQCKKIG